jgi:hypothetical protein
MSEAQGSDQAGEGVSNGNGSAGQPAKPKRERRTLTLRDRLEEQLATAEAKAKMYREKHDALLDDISKLRVAVHGVQPPAV